MKVLSGKKFCAEVELTCPQPAEALNRLQKSGIDTYDVTFTDALTLRFSVHSAQLPHLRAIAEERGDCLQVRHLKQLRQFVTAWMHRKLLLSGIGLLLMLVLFLPTRVLFVRVEGNVALPEYKILEAAENCGIRFGADRSQVRSEQVKNELLSALPQLQWAGVNTKGCVALISVRERSTEAEPSSGAAVASIVASRDGIVDSCTALRGNLLCYRGQAVKAGQVLISGYTDCGLLLQATCAQGEVYAITSRDLTVVCPNNRAKLAASGVQSKKYSLILGKKRINLWKGSGICPATCGRMYEEYHITLPGGYDLPVALAVETCVSRELLSEWTDDQQASLEEFSRRYLLTQMIAGQILRCQTQYTQGENAVLLSATYVCREMIGRLRQEQIGEYYVENN